MKTLEHWADTPEGRERYRANEPTIEVFIKDVEELEKSQKALEETLLLCGKCQAERKARDAKILQEVKNIEANLLIGNNKGALILVRCLKLLLEGST